MSIHADIKAEMGDGPAYPHTNDFTTYFGYGGGKVIGTFDSIADAKAAGATNTEKNVDKTAYDAAMADYRAHQAKIGDEWNRRVRAEYPEFNDATFAAINSKAYEDGHSAGYGEVENYISIYADFATTIINANKG